ncbi:hypothetical protein BC828DRAFT_376284 [Blastocladiella britannica]|nr:hypothetical protein BC828DRAFT_376284 [Blastocladiella britannica]
MPAAPMIPQRFTGGMPPPLPQGTQSLGTTSPMRRGRPQSVGGMQQQMGQPGSLPPMPMMGSAGPPLGSGLDMSSAAAAATSAGGMPMPVTSMAMSAPMSGGAPQSSPYGAPPPMAAPPPQIMPWDAFGDGGGGQVSTTGGSTSRYSSMPMPSYEAYDPRMHFQAQQRTSSAIASAATSAATSATATGSGAPNLLLSSSGAAAPFMSLGSPEYQTGPNGATSGFSGGGGGDSAALSAQGRAQSLSTAGLLSAGGGGAGDTPASSPMYTSPPGSDPFRTAMYAVPPPSSAPPVMSMPVVTPPTAGMSASAQQQQQMQQQGYLGDGHTVGSRPKAQSVSGLIGRFDMMEMTQSPAQTAATPPPVPQKPPARGHRKSPSVGSTPVPQSAVPGQSSVPSMPGTSTAGWTPPSFASRVTAAEPQGPQPSWNPTRIIPPPPPNYSAPPVMPSGSGALSPSSADGGGAGYLAPMSPVPRVSSSPQPYLTAAEEAATTAATSPPSRSPVGSVVVRLYRGKELRMHYLDRLLNSGWEFKPKYFTRVVTESWRQRLVNRGGAPCMGFWLDRISQVRPVDGLHTHLRALLLVHYVLAHSDAVMACELANSRAREIVDRLARQWIASTAGVAQRPRDVFVEHYGKLLIKALEFHARMHSANPAHQATAGSVAAAAPDGSFHVARPELLTPDAMVELAEAAGGLIVDLQPLVVFFLDPETSNARCAMAYDPAVCVELHTAVLLLVESAYAAYTLHMYLLAGILRNPPPPTSAAAPRVGAMIDRLMNISNLIGHFAACASKVALASEIDAACYVIPRHRPSTDTSAAWSQPPSRVPKMLHRLRRFGLDTSALGNDVARLAEAGTITRRPEYGSVYSAADAEFDDSEQSS